MAATNPYALLGDVGGTNVRFVLTHLPDGGAPLFGDARNFRTSDFPSLEAVVEEFLGTLAPQHRPSVAVLGVAGPVTNGEVRFTNLNWTVSERVLGSCGFAHVKLLNDFEALALGVPELSEADFLPLGGPQRGMADGAIAIMGAGTGFGVSGGYCHGPHARPLVTEGGHIAFAPNDETELEILRILMARFGRVSVERILSGPGLFNLCEALCAIDGRRPDDSLKDSHAIIEAARSGHAGARKTVERFVMILGAVAGDFALSFGARGGVFFAGGLTQGMTDFLGAPAFRARFEDKGRFVSYLRAIPTKLIIRANAAHLGLARVAAKFLRAEEAK